MAGLLSQLLAAGGLGGQPQSGSRPSFVGPSPQEVEANRRRLAQAQGMQARDPWTFAGQMAQALSGTLQGNKLKKKQQAALQRQQEQAQKKQQATLKAVQGYASGALPDPSMHGPPVEPYSTNALVQGLNHPGVDTQQYLKQAKALQDLRPKQEAPSPKYGDVEVDPVSGRRYQTGPKGKWNFVDPEQKTQAPKELPSSIREYQWAKKNNHFTGTFAEWKKVGGGNTNISVNTGVKRGKPPAGFQWITGADGEDALRPIQGGPADGRYSESQLRLVETANRMKSSANVLESRMADGRPLWDVLSDTGQATMGAMPGVGNFMVSEDYQRAKQAMADSSQALLRLETGSAAPQAEADEVYDRYAPKPGDSTAVKQQKFSAFISRWRTAEKAAGPNYKREFGLSAPESAPKLYEKVEPSASVEVELMPVASMDEISVDQEIAKLTGQEATPFIMSQAFASEGPTVMDAIVINGQQVSLSQLSKKERQQILTQGKQGIISKGDWQKVAESLQ